MSNPQLEQKNLLTDDEIQTINELIASFKHTIDNLETIKRYPKQSDMEFYYVLHDHRQINQHDYNDALDYQLSKLKEIQNRLFPEE